MQNFRIESLYGLSGYLAPDKPKSGRKHDKAKAIRRRKIARRSRVYNLRNA